MADNADIENSAPAALTLIQPMFRDHSSSGIRPSLRSESRNMGVASAVQPFTELVAADLNRSPDSWSAPLA
jgi:hypothetical protein